MIRCAFRSPWFDPSSSFHWGSGGCLGSTYLQRQDRSGRVETDWFLADFQHNFQRTLGICSQRYQDSKGNPSRTPRFVPPKVHSLREWGGPLPFWNQKRTCCRSAFRSTSSRPYRCMILRSSPTWFQTVWGGLPLHLIAHEWIAWLHLWTCLHSSPFRVWCWWGRSRSCVRWIRHCCAMHGMARLVTSNGAIRSSWGVQFAAGFGTINNLIDGPDMMLLFEDVSNAKTMSSSLFFRRGQKRRLIF